MKTTKRAARRTTPTASGLGTGLKDKPDVQLRRAVTNCLLFENQFYKSGDAIAASIHDLVPQVDPVAVSDLAIYARRNLGLRHVSLYLAASMAHHYHGTALVGDTIASVIERADELVEFPTLYWKLNGREATSFDRWPRLSSQAKRGLGLAFTKFDEYQLAKYNRPTAPKLRDVLFLAHPKATNPAQERLWKRLIKGELATPDTWEVELSKGGRDKQAAWLRLLRERKIGPLALLRNLRNMQQAGVTPTDIKLAINIAAWERSRILPYQFITAAHTCPDFENEIGNACERAAVGTTKLPGRTLVVVDVSGSMTQAMSARGGSPRLYAAGAITLSLAAAATDVTIYATGGDDGRRIHATKKMPPRKGLALCDAIYHSVTDLGGGGIFLTQCMDFIVKTEKEMFDRVIVITDEADCDTDPARAMHKAKQFGIKGNYIVNVGSYKSGLGEGAGWTTIHGFSERVADWVYATEAEAA